MGARARVVGASSLLVAGFALGAFGLHAAVGSSPAAPGERPYTAVAAGLARDGYAPTSTPTPRPTATPTPTPVPAVASQCYEPSESGGYDVRPASERSVLRNCQVIAYYGFPGVPGLGVLGEGTPDEMVARLRREAAAFDAANGPPHVMPAMHLIYAVAQPDSTGDALYRMPAAQLEQQLALADAYDLLVILDVQMGHSTVDAEIPPLLPYLSNPRVHLALDPEWAMKDGVAPGTVIGGIDASWVNRAQELMQQYIEEHHLANKMLIVHQFTPDMIRNKSTLQEYPGVDLVIDMDGFGGQAIKLAHYDQFIAQDNAEFGGIKLFYDEDVGLMTADQVVALHPQPAFVVYQ